MNSTSQLTKLLRILAGAIENMSDDEVNQLLSGRAKLTVLAKQTPKTSAPTEQDALLLELNNCSDRQQALQLLGTISSRDALAAFARTLKVHIVKHDRREDIESKLVEFLIGGKLRTEAIQTLNLKGAGRKAEDSAETKDEGHLKRVTGDTKS